MRLGKIGIITYSKEGFRAAVHLQRSMDNVTLFLHSDFGEIHQGAETFSKVSTLMEASFRDFVCWIFIAPCGVAVRSIAPHIQSKLYDPAVLVIDAGARHVVSLLSGHEGGANEFAVHVSNLLAADPVISTTTDAAKIWIAGIGCRKGVCKETIMQVLDEALQIAGITVHDIRFFATAAIKKNEQGLLDLSSDLNISLRYFPDFMIQEMESKVDVQPFVQERVGLPGVAEPAALLGGKRTTLCVKRIAKQGVTVALAKENCWWWESAPEAEKTERTGQ
ncbi:MAG: cobalamin biosynthesis protein CbiG [Fibrobacter sp.]|nr:cobalamin biosynthesis protein CbiG [Fibrobacter sp.]